MRAAALAKAAAANSSGVDGVGRLWKCFFFAFLAACILRNVSVCLNV